MIWPLVAASALLTGQARLALGDYAALAPSAAVAWGLVCARRSRRGSFATTTVFAALIEAPTYDAPLVVPPLAALVAGLAAYLTRYALPVRTPRGEGAAAALFAVLGAFVLERMKEGPPADWPSIVGGAILTGATTAGLVLLERRAPSVRATLAKR
jgi:hypothetical protein